MMRLFETTGRT